MCGPQRLRDERRKFAENLIAYGGRIVLVAVTAPGADVLPWGSDCAQRGRHRCAGDHGCRVDQRAALPWNRDASERYGRLWRAAMQAADRRLRRMGHEGPMPRRVAVAWGPQKRGVWHVHEALPAETPIELTWSRTVVEYLSRVGPRHRWGYVDRNPLRRLGGAVARVGVEASRAAAAYLAANAAGYLSENTSAAPERWIPGRRVRGYVSRRLTAQTGVTMRNLRLARRYWWLTRHGLELPDEWTDDLRRLLAYLCGFVDERGPPIGPAAPRTAS